jgi:type IV pilus assembly protein PilM
MSQRIVGLDIGTSAIRAVELTVGEGAKPVLEAYGQVGLPPGTVVDGEIRDRAGAVQAIQRLWRDGGFSEKRVLIGVAGLRAITRELDMPMLPLDELDNAVRFQADEVIPFPMERTALSSKVIAQYTDKEGAPTLRVLVAAAHRDLIDSVVAVAQGAGLEPVGIDLNTAALVRCLYDSNFTGGPEAIVSVGAGLTLVVVHQGGVLQFVRTVDLGGESITKAIASTLDLPVVDAEAIKRRLGESGEADPRARSAIEHAVGELVTEVHNSIRFFSSLPGRGAVGRVLVTGAGARIDGFLAALQDGLDMPVIAASPLSMVDTSRLPISEEQAESINPTLAVPVGLAIPDPSGRPFNLLPAEVMQEAGERKARRVLIGVGIGIVVVVAGMTLWRILAVNHAKSQVSTLNANITNIRLYQIPKYDKAVALKSQVQVLEAQGVPAVSGEIDWLVVLNQISQYQPTTATLSTLTMSTTPHVATTPTSTKTASLTIPASAQTLVGTIGSTVTVPDLPGVTTWGLSMSQAPALNNIIPTGTLANSPTGVTFTANMQINGNAHTQRLSEFTQVLP